MGSMQNKRKIDIIIPSFHSRILTEICVKSFKKFCPNNISLRYIVVENSDDISYKNNIVAIDSSVQWVENKTSLVGSEANASAIEVGLKHVGCDMVFLCHCDVCVTSDLFFYNMMEKYNDGYKMVGTLFDTHPKRIGALHISGLLVNYDLSKKVEYKPRNKGAGIFMDAGDGLTEYCRNKNIPYYCFRNTHNYPDLCFLLEEKYSKFKSSVCMDEKNRAIFLHLSRGIPKTNGTFSKTNRVDLSEWSEFCGDIIK